MSAFVIITLMGAAIVVGIIIEKLEAIARHLGELETTLDKAHAQQQVDLGTLVIEVTRLREHFDPDDED